MFKSSFKAFVAILTIGVFAQAAAADEIALTLIENGITITGEYVGFTDNAYIVKTSTGEIYVPSMHVTCEGNDCLPNLTNISQASG